MTSNTIIDALRERDLDAIAVDVAARRGVPLAGSAAADARRASPAPATRSGGGSVTTPSATSASPRSRASSVAITPPSRPASRPTPNASPAPPSRPATAKRHPPVPPWGSLRAPPTVGRTPPKSADPCERLHAPPDPRAREHARAAPSSWAAASGTVRSPSPPANAAVPSSWRDLVGAARCQDGARGSQVRGFGAALRGSLRGRLDGTRRRIASQGARRARRRRVPR